MVTFRNWRGSIMELSLTKIEVLVWLWARRTVSIYETEGIRTNQDSLLA